MDAQQQLFGLMAVAEEHQKAVKAALDGLAVERVALARERAAVAQAAASVASVASDVRKAGDEAIPAIQRAAGWAVGESVRQSLADASEVAATALSEAAKPILVGLAGVVKEAAAVEGTLQKAGQWFAWKWVAVAAGGLVGVCLVAYASLAWQSHQVELLTKQKADLNTDIAQLQTTVADLEKKGGRIRLGTCGPTARLCVVAAQNQGEGYEDYHAPWESTDKKLGYVIPKGY